MQLKNVRKFLDKKTMSKIGIYQRIILEHSKSPRNYKKLDKFTHYCEGNNPLCGDKVEIYTNIKNKKTNEITFQGKGCVISIASASILTRVLRKKTIQDSKIISENFIKMVENKKYNFNFLNDNEKKLLMTFSEIKKFPMRFKCATMSWTTFNSAVKYVGYNNEV